MSNIFDNKLVTFYLDSPNAYEEPKITIKYNGVFYTRIYKKNKFEYNHHDVKFVEDLIEFAKTICQKEISKNYHASGDAEKFIRALGGGLKKFKDLKNESS